MVSEPTSKFSTLLANTYNNGVRACFDSINKPILKLIETKEFSQETVKNILDDIKARIAAKEANDKQ